MRSFIACLTALLLVLSGCGGQGTPPPESPASPVSQETPEPAPEQPAPENPPSEGPDDALAREMILAYGGELAERKDGTHLTTKPVSLFQMPYSWHWPEEIPFGWYDVWFLTSTFEEEDRLERYADPREEGWFFPGEVYEERIGARFGAGPELLRQNPGYDPQAQGYRMAGVDSGGARQEITYTYERQPNHMVLDITLEDEVGNSWADTFRLIADLREDGGWTFRSCECLPRELPRQGEARGNTAVLTEEQWALLDRAEELVQIFQMSTDYMGNFYSTVDYGNRVQIDGKEGYCLYIGDKYKSFEDLRAQMCEVLTEDFFDELNQYGTFVGHEGRLYLLNKSRDPNRTYLWDEDRFSAKAAGEEIGLTRYAYYTDNVTYDDENAYPARVRAMPIRLRNTGDGWRVDHLRLPC